MEKVYLDCQVRQETGKNKMGALRRGGFVPAVVYGRHKDPLTLKIDHSHLVKFMHAHHGGENMVIMLQVAADGKKSKDERPVIIKDIQYDPIQDHVLHVDFNEISLTEKITVNIPIEVIGEAEGVKKENGVLTHILWEIEAECLPTEIPEKIECDVTAMKIGDSVHVKDLSIPAGVTVITEQDAMVLDLAPPRKEEEVVEAAPEGEVAAEPEVIKKEKKPKEEGAEEPGEQAAS